MTLYRPPFDPYSERQEANDPNPALRSPWDGCWAWTLARAINGTTGGKVTCIVPGKTVERVIRDAAGVPDRAGFADGGTLANQITALGKLAPKGTWYSSRPTQAEFRAHLAAGGIAVMAGWEDQAPISDRPYDPGFYDRHGSNGHSVFCQGVGDGKNVYWGNPEKFSGIPEPIVTIDAALRFVWDSQAGGYPRVEAILLKSVELAPPVPAPAPYEPRIAMKYVPVSPFRFADSRGEPALFLRPKLHRGLNAIQVGGMGGVPADATAVVLKLEVIYPALAGWIEAGPDSGKPGTSVNWFSATPLGTDGKPLPTTRAWPMNLIATLAAGGMLYVWLESDPVDWDMDVRGWFTP